jgi:hypothetical protein
VRSSLPHRRFPWPPPTSPPLRLLGLQLPRRQALVALRRATRLHRAFLLCPTQQRRPPPPGPAAAAARPWTSPPRPEGTRGKGRAQLPRERAKRQFLDFYLYTIKKNGGHPCVIKKVTRTYMPSS